LPDFSAVHSTDVTPKERKMNSIIYLIGLVVVVLLVLSLLGLA